MITGRSITFPEGNSTGSSISVSIKGSVNNKYSLLVQKNPVQYRSLPKICTTQSTTIKCCVSVSSRFFQKAFTNQSYINDV